MVGGRSAGMQARRPPANQRASARKIADIKKIRVKVHSEAETRYILIGLAVEYADFESKVREKFGLKRRLKVEMQDEGDMITMGDQDDLDMLIESARSEAKAERQEMGKMEVSFGTTFAYCRHYHQYHQQQHHHHHLLLLLILIFKLILRLRSGFKKSERRLLI